MADIELVIKIPEKYYNDICNSETASRYSVLYALDGIRKGTPLPKGHGRLKDENEIKRMIGEAKVNSEHSKTFAENIIRFAPTIMKADEAESEV